jgi:hypothetical protein
MYSLEETVGSTVCVAVQLPDGTHTYHLGEVVEVNQLEICLKRVAWVKHTGRHFEFMAGNFTSNAEIEVYPPDSVKRVPRWGSEVTDWPFEIPKESI